MTHDFKKVQCGGVAKTEFQMPCPSVCAAVSIKLLIGLCVSVGRGMCVWVVYRNDHVVKPGCQGRCDAVCFNGNVGVVIFCCTLSQNVLISLFFFSSPGALRCTVSLLAGIRRRGAAEISHTVNKCIETEEKSLLELTKAVGT